MACTQCKSSRAFTQPPKSGYGFISATLDAIEQLPEIQTFLDEIQDLRHNTRPGYPPRSMLRAICLKFLLNERFNVGLIRRLQDSPKLRQICGFKSEVPSEPSFSRFFKHLADRANLIEQSITSLVNHIHDHLPDTGDVVAIDSTDIEAYANPNRGAVIDQDAQWGARTAKNKSANNPKNTEMFFGYKVHMLSDTIYGVPLSYIVLPANRNDSPQLPRVFKDAQKAYPWLQPTHFLADRGYDANSHHEMLHRQSIRPIIHMKRPSKVKLYDGIYTAKGEPTCMGKKVMEYVKTDPQTGHHLYRCPPAGCHRKTQAHMFMTNCNDQHWENPADNLRVIGVVARTSPEWNRMYKQRTVIERGFSSMKRSRLLDKHQYLTQRKIRTHVGLSVLTYTATMLARVLASDVMGMRRMRRGNLRECVNRSDGVTFL